MRYFLFLLALVPVSLSAQPTITYNIFFSDQLEKDGLKVEVIYRPEHASDSLVYFYDEELWGVDNLFDGLIILQDENQDSRVVKNREKDKVTVYGNEDGFFSLTYRIKQTFEEPEYDVFVRPVVHDHYFHIVGQLLFVLPEELTEYEEPINFNLNWIGFPDDFVIHNNFGSQLRRQEITVTLWDKFFDSIFVGGDYRIFPFEVYGKPVYLAVRDQWFNGVTDTYLLQVSQQAVQSQREFWQDFEKEYFTIVLTPTVTQADSSFPGTDRSGTALYNGFMIQSTNNPFNDKEMFPNMLHHEMMHHWIGSLMQMKHPRLMKWFSEGFTDYFAYKNRLRIGDLTPDEWTELLNENVLRFHWNNPQRNIPNYRIETDFWTSMDFQRVPYNRGTIFAFWLDNQILRKTDYKKSLDDLMLELYQTVTVDQLEVGDELVIDLANKYLDDDIYPFFQQYVIVGEDIPFEELEWITGISFSRDDQVPVLGVEDSILELFFPSE